MGALSASENYDYLDAIDRGIYAGSIWRVRTDPDGKETDALLEVSVIRDGGSIGYKLYLPGGRFGNVPRGVSNLTSNLDITKFLKHVISRKFVKV